jgi:P-type Mg2+ transporter
VLRIDASPVLLRLGSQPRVVARLGAVRTPVGDQHLASVTFSLCGQRAPSRSRAQPDTPDAYWALDPVEVMRHLHSEPVGLSSAEAARRLAQYGPNELREQSQLSRARVLWNQLRSPLLLLLVFAAGASALTGAWIDAAIVLTILVASIGIGYSREYRAQVAADQLRARVQAVATVLRDARPVTIPLGEVVPGDVVVLAAGSLLPADALVLEATDYFVNEAVLTGESFPVEKRPGVVARTSVLTERANCVFLGTNVRSGTARCLVVATGPATQFGAIAHQLTLRPPETEFDRGIRRFGPLGGRHDGVCLLDHEGFVRSGSRACPLAGVVGLRRAHLEVLAGVCPARKG